MPNISTLDSELIAAVEGRETVEVKRLLGEGANPNAKKGKKSVFELADRRDTATVAALIRAGAWNKRVEGMLVWAVIEGLPEVVKILLEKGADPNAKALAGTALEVASERGEMESIEHLLAHGADPDAGDGDSTPLLAALGSERVQVAERLLQGGAAPDHMASMGTTTPLAVASALGMTGLVERLLGAGADPNQLCPQVVIKRFRSTVGGPDTYPLLVAGEHGHTEAVLALLEAGASLERRDGLGRSLFDLATPEVAEALALAGYRAAARPPAEELLLASEQGEALKVVESLAQGASIETRDSRRARKGWTPLMLAAAEGHEACLDAILEAKPSLEAREEGDERKARMLAGESDPTSYRRDFEGTLGRTALHLAVERGHQEIAIRLLEAGADPGSKDFLADTPLTSAAEAGMADFLRRAHQRGVPLEGKGRTKEDMLALACENGHSEVVRLLLASRPKISSKDLDKALLKACAQCDLATARALLERGATAAAADRETGTAWCTTTGASRYVQVDPATPRKPGAMHVWNEHGVRALVPYPEEEILAMLELLRPHGGDLNKEGPLGPPLMVAVRAGLPRVVRALIDWGAQPQPEAMETAELYGHAEVKELLAELGSPTKPAPPSQPEPTPSSYKELRPPSFAKTGKDPAFRSAVDELAAICQGKISKFPSAAGAFLVQVKATEQSKLDLPSLQASYQARGYYVVGYGSPSRQGPDKLAVFPSPNPYHALAAIAPSGGNYEVGPGNIVDWFVAREAEGRTFTFSAFGHDLVVGRFTSSVEDADRLAELMYELCPDTVEQGVGSLEELARLLAEDGKFYLWWD